MHSIWHSVPVPFAARVSLSSTVAPQVQVSALRVRELHGRKSLMFRRPSFSAPSEPFCNQGSEKGADDAVA